LMRAMVFGDAAYPRFGAQQIYSAGTGDYADALMWYSQSLAASHSYPDVTSRIFVWASLSAY
jgi:hypothetical protein